MTARPSRAAVGIDVGIAVLFAVAAYLEAAGHGDDTFRGSAPPVVGGVVAALAPLPLVARRLRPLTSTVAIVGLAFLPHLVISYDLVFVGGLVVVTIALESAARYGARPRNRLALLAVVPCLVALSVIVPGFAGQAAVYAAILLSGWALGVLIRALADRHAALRGELDARAATQALQLERAVTEERARVARDLHDVIAHCVSVMVLQSGAARLRLSTDRDGSAAAISHIESTGREALVELERMLGLLRGDPLDDPSASLVHLDRLVEQVRGAGLQVSIHVQGDPSVLPAALDRSLYRVAQESLTNALKHGQGAHARLRLTVADDRVAMEVDNPAVAGRVSPLPGGNGQTGMIERIAAFGGRLSTGLVAGRYEVHAEVPLRGASS